MMKMLGKSLKPAVLFSRGLGDYVFSIPHVKHEHFPVLGIRTKEQDDKILVTYVAKESTAEKNGINKDDIITAVDGVEIKTKEQLHVLLAVKNWGDSINITVAKFCQTRFFIINLRQTGFRCEIRLMQANALFHGHDHHQRS